KEVEQIALAVKHDEYIKLYVFHKPVEPLFYVAVGDTAVIHPAIVYFMHHLVLKQVDLNFALITERDILVNINHHYFGRKLPGQRGERLDISRIIVNDISCKSKFFNVFYITVAGHYQ